METKHRDETKGEERTRQVRRYPSDTLEEAAGIAKAIYERNAGLPMDRLMLAKAIGRTPASSAFRSLITSSARYELTKGNYNAPEIRLTPLGEAAVGAKNPHERSKALLQAALKPEIFRGFYTSLDQKKFPEDEYAENMLRRDFKVASRLCKECLSIIKANANYAGLFTSIGGSLYISLRGAEERVPIPEPLTAVERGPTEEAELPLVPEERKLAKYPEAKEIRVFISHGKNKRILEQVKTMLEFGKYDYEVAVETETTAIPVPQKIQDAMRRCNAGIIIISADEQERLENERYGVNKNVLIEIGAAFVLYDQKVVLLVDRRVDLPSNLQGLYRCEYKGDELSWEAGLNLQKAITNFRSEAKPNG